MTHNKYDFNYHTFKNQNKEILLDNQKKISLTPKKILVVDDDQGILEALQAILEYGGFDVVIDNGKDIDRKIGKYAPDLILMDISLGGKNGSLICTELKKDPETKNIPIILISAYFNLYNLPRVNLADDFIAKPFDMEELLGKVSGLLK